MQQETRVTRDYGHPWDRRPGFDLLEIRADSEAERDRLIAAAERKFWRVWISGHELRSTPDGRVDWPAAEVGTGKPAAALYKPCDIAEEWSDSLSHPHPGHVRGPGADAPQSGPVLGPEPIRQIVRGEEADGVLGVAPSPFNIEPYEAVMAAQGWARYPTDRDSGAFGVWVNPDLLRVFTYCEGDRVLEICEDRMQYADLKAYMHLFYRPQQEAAI